MADSSVVAAFNRAIRDTGSSKKLAKALFEAGIVESNLENLDYGDRDSLGPLQQRPSQGWKNARNPYKAALDFLSHAAPLADEYSSAGDLAQAVQRSGFPERYGQQSKAASRYVSGVSTGGTPQPQANTASADPTYVPGTITQQLAAQLTRPERPQASALALPTAAAAPRLAGGGVTPQSGGAAPAPRFDAATALATLQAQPQPQQPKTSDDGAPSRSQCAPSSGGKSGSKVLELIHNDGSGPGYGIKNGQTVNGSQVFAAVWDGHQNHVHVAAGRKTVVALGKLAERLGLHVSENSHFGGVDPGAHVPDSYHDRDQAIDASGSAKAMDAFSKAVTRYNRTRKLPT